MAVDLSEFEALIPQNGCMVGRILNDLSDQDAANLRGALATDIKTIPHTVIQAWLQAHGIKIGPGPIVRHRHGKCLCKS